MTDIRKYCMETLGRYDNISGDASVRLHTFAKMVLAALDTNSNPGNYFDAGCAYQSIDTVKAMQRVLDEAESGK